MFADLLDAHAPLDARIRNLYALKESGKTLANVEVLHKAIDTTDSVLLQHEILYNIGQFGFRESIPVLQQVALSVEQYDVVSRHEALESIGAIGDSDSKSFLQRVADESTEAPIVESALLALKRITTKEAEGNESVAPLHDGHFVSVDPSPAFKKGTKTVDEIGAVLCDEKQDLWHRYKAMFSLRNLGNDKAVEWLCKALRSDKSSCLFRHEVAFVLGQMEAPSSSAALQEAVRDDSEHPMVRHEAAEALGAMADDANLACLNEFAVDSPPLVRDSCAVALEMHKYWSNFKKHDE